jgi:succinyl-diaminopimelate desuccinylase
VTDLLSRTAELIDIPSVSHGEAAIADHLESQLRSTPALEVVRIADNVVARTGEGRGQRLVLAGHVDTVPANGNEHARTEGNRLHGIGAADMKGGIAVMLELALLAGGSSGSGPAPSGPRVARGSPDAGAASHSPSAMPDSPDLTFVFYACEEVATVHSGLRAIEAARPDLLEADAAILGEPTSALVEAGCQGTLRLGLTLVGERAHTARPWMGRNAIHRMAPLLERLAAFEGRRPVIDGCEYRESLQAVFVSGGVAGNVVPDRARLTVNHRFAPDRSVDEAFDAVRAVLGPALDEAGGDEILLEDAAPAAPPGLGHPLLSGLVAASGTPPRAKLGWTDVAFFAGRGVPAANYGPGDPSLSHTAGEYVERAELERALATLRSLVGR